MTAHHRRRSVRPAALALALALAAPATTVRAASEADAFEDIVKPVSGQLYTKSGKLELTVPAGSISFNDAFFSKYMVGGKLGYHVSESFSFAVLGSYAFASPTGSTSVCRANQGCTPATPAQLYQVPGRINWLAGAELAFSPVYGKLNLFAEKAIHFDLSILAGPDLVSYRDVLPAAAANTGGVPGNKTSVGGHLGVGARVFFARFMALQLEVKDVLYSVPSLPSGKLQTQLLANVGLSFFLPVTRGNAP